MGDGLDIASHRVDRPADIVAAIKGAVDAVNCGAPYLLEFVVKEGQEFPRY